MLVFFVQLAIAIAVSGGMLYLIGSTFYIGMSVLVFVVAFAVVHANERSYRKSDGEVVIDEEQLSRSAIDFLTQLGIVAYAAVFWPSLPIIFARGRYHDEKRQAGSSGPSA